MNYRFFHSPLLALALLAGTLGCSKQTDPAPALVTGTSSYELTSRHVNGAAHIVASQDTGYDFLEVPLTTTPSRPAEPRRSSCTFPGKRASPPRLTSWMTS